MVPVQARMRGVDLEVSERELVLKAGDTYSLQARLPYAVDPNAAASGAKWSKRDRVLTVTTVVKPLSAEGGATCCAVGIREAALNLRQRLRLPRSVWRTSSGHEQSG